MHQRQHTPAAELAGRMTRLRSVLDGCDPAWQVAVVMGKVNLFYLTGTMPNGVLIIPRSDDAVLYVRRSLARARDESEFARIEGIGSFRDLAGVFPVTSGPAHVETEVLTLAALARFTRHVPVQETRALDTALALTRAVKSDYELALMRQAGEIHRYALEEYVPSVLREGMSEAELGTLLLSEMLRRGYHGVARIAMFDTDLLFGQISFGENAVYPSAFNGPDGVLGLSAAVPYFGSRERCLRANELVFVDVACGVGGYHTDKTTVYAFGRVPAGAEQLHQRCVAIHDAVAARLCPGAVPSAIHDDVTSGLDDAFLGTFMGTEHDQVRFLGHGIGLTIDECPVIAAKFDEPLQANMTIAVEPKIGIPGVGMVGLENTFAVTPDGGVSLTGTGPGLVRI